jgi:hypothetical protein
MIYTKFGKNVKIQCGNMVSGEVDILFLDEKKTMKTYVWELNADNGIKEIEEEILKLF